MRYGNPSKKTKVVSSLKGHSIEFPGKGTLTKDNLPEFPASVPAERRTMIAADGMVFVHVPAGLHAEMSQNGLVPETEIEEKDAPAGPVRPEDAEELRKQVYTAFDKLVEKADRESFGGHGVPKGNAIEKVLGYPLNNAEIKDLWTKYTIDKKDA